MSKHSSYQKRKAFPDFPFNILDYLWKLNAHGDNRSKAFSDFPFSTRVYLWTLNARIDNRSNRVSNS
ncbi:hypothetical protein P7K49_040361 [Saguinus oedipus]|uniref:Uncharacterized protein n=1 Tax=Saguinus oedipus TaxID=9490 RepID=A0ABQ9T9P5_SAGOE|nr:hypothetical protein P7K49_040359 [Saguinus oedipus]KAK2081455.1 hypothetical protein P7K49_040361 [Saguinus oedipus]